MKHNKTVCTVLFIDDDPKAGELLQRFFRDPAYRFQVFRNSTDAVQAFEQVPADLVITDLRMPGMSGVEVLARIRQLDAEVPVIIVTAYASTDSAIEALRLGATDFIKKPYDPDELVVLVEKTLERTRLRRENRWLKRQLQAERARYGMVGTSAAMQAIHRFIDKVAEVQCSVIIEGESGTGKELAARAIHERGPYANEPFMVIDCGGLSDTLLESELFGHQRGAFTGAERDRTGLLAAARVGTVFLDEIGNISESMQMKLLRVLEARMVTPVGSISKIPIRARFVTATHCDLKALVAQGRFRQDLYHRLNVVTLHMPSLRERREDIPALVQHFAVKFAEEYGRPLRSFSSQAIRQLCERRWEGNVRELRNYVERCVIMADGELLDFCPAMTEGAPAAEEQPSLLLPKSELLPSAVDASSTPDEQTLGRMEAVHIQRVLSSVGGNQSEAAARLGINRSTLWRKLRHMRTG